MTFSSAAAFRLPIWLVLSLVVLVQLPTISTSFCGFDDFNETFRAQFEDTPNPSRIFTTSHFESFKYRPGNRLLTWACTRAGQGSAWPFRLRNLLLHLLNVYLIYRLTLFLFGSPFLAAAASLLFGLHHLTHQNIHAAIFTNTWAYALILSGLLASLAVARSSRWAQLSFLAAVANCLAILSYDPALFSVGLLPLHAACRWLTTQDPGISWRRLLGHTAMQVGAVVVSFALRHAFVPDSMPSITPLPVVFRILVNYAAAILIPFDTVSLQYWLDSSITKQLASETGFVYALAGALAVGAALLSFFAWRRGWHSRISDLDLANMLFLGGATLAAVLPTSLGSPHASETYVYFATALCMPLLVVFASRLFAVTDNIIARRIFINLFVGIVIVFGIFDFTRSLMVMECGDISKKVLQTLAADPGVRAGVPLRVSRSPFDPPLRHVGIYGLVGLDTVGVGPFASAALRNALSLTLGRVPVDAEVVSPEELRRVCSANSPEGVKPLCFYIHADGYLEPRTQWQIGTSPTTP